MGNTTQKAKDEQRVSKCIHNFKQLVVDVRHINLNRTKFFTTANGEVLHFVVYSKLTESQSATLLWRLGSNVIVGVATVPMVVISIFHYIYIYVIHIASC